jgi:undecaprenyl diphosphate synthase
MNLLREFFDYTDRELDESNIRIKVIGLRNRLEDDIVQRIEKAERKTRNKTGLTFLIALDYGARSEITHAAREIAQKCKEGRMEPDDICEDVMSDHLFTAGIPDPDLIIRSSGDRRMSNFLLWQASYSELWFSNILWPDFRLKHLLKAVRDYNRRSRRYGGLKG